MIRTNMGCTIKIERAKSLGGWTDLHYSCFRDSDKLEVCSGVGSLLDMANMWSVYAYICRRVRELQGKKSEMLVFHVEDDGFYAAPTREAFDVGYKDLVGEENYHEHNIEQLSADQVSATMIDDTDENEHPTGKKLSLQEIMDEYVSNRGEGFYCLACIAY